MNSPLCIGIRGARTHNLKNVSLDIPLGQITVISGPSGCGKSSLAVDTLFAEGQRRFLEASGGSSRHLLRRLVRPDVDAVTSLPPAVHLDQRPGQAPSRSTLSVTAQVHDDLRLLYARCGIIHCPSCGRALQRQSVSEIVEHVEQFPDRTKFLILAPVGLPAGDGLQECLQKVIRSGLVRVRIDGEVFDIDDPDIPSSDDVSSSHSVQSVEAVVDRLILKDGIRPRLYDSISLAVREGDGCCIVSVQHDDQWQDHLFHTRCHCEQCDQDFPDPDPGLFRFSSARAACSLCGGTGCRPADSDADSRGTDDTPCPACRGSRLQPFASAVQFGQMTIGRFSEQTVDQALLLARRWRDSIFRTTDSRTSADGPSEIPQMRPGSLPAARVVLPDLVRRLQALQRVGLGYLRLSRTARTLSGGEYQRARLAACLATDVQGICCILDEPTAGLHAADTQQLIENLRALKQAGATPVVVEHSPEVVRAADHVIEMGPAAGQEGGRILFSGRPQDLPPETPTGRFLRRNEPSAGTGPATDSDLSEASWIGIRGAVRHNLKGIHADFLLRGITCVTGVSGSGKSALVIDSLVPAVRTALTDPGRGAAAGCCESLSGTEHLQRLVFVDDHAGRGSRRSCVATVSGMWNEVRRLFAATRTARAHGLSPRHFSFSSGPGRCPACRGTGVENIRMRLLPDATVRCPACQGRRFRPALLRVQFAGYSIDKILALRIDEAMDVFSEIASVQRRLQPFRDVGLGYLTLGQPGSSWSGGEAQRVRLAAELLEPNAGTTLYVLDEPTRGLHGSDTARLLGLLRSLVSRGHSVVVTEHSLQVIRASDWIIDLGPGPGEDGGRVVVCGPPDRVAACADSRTGQCLRAASGTSADRDS